jgi:murein DD-endopeptidase MepM/ murein hydrolase activator NlpD
MMQRGSSVPAFVLLILAVVVFGGILWYNARPVPDLVPIIPTEIPEATEANAWQGILRQGFGSNSTPLPTVAIPTAQFEPPTLPAALSIDATSIAPSQLDPLLSLTGAPASIGVTPTPPPPTPANVATDLPITVEAVTRPPSSWQPPPLVPPISRDPYGRDHYWFIRPVDSNGVNYALSTYPFGSDGPVDNPLRVHHGIDMPNPIGETVRAAGSGTIVWAADGLRTEGAVFENSPSYGNVVVIQQDFGYQGKTLYTIYAHLSAALVMRDQHVNAGDAIGLVGNTGNVTGPHVHFEVRLGENRYGDTYNPVLWMVPYVGHGVIAGRVSDSRGNTVGDADITIRNWSTGLVAATATTYVIQNTGYDVKSDPVWQENFAVGDMPTGRYEVITAVDGIRVSRIIDVLEGTTSFVDLSAAGATATEDSASPNP